MDAELTELCADGIFPKLSFLLEELDDANLKVYFESPGEKSPVDQAAASQTNLNNAISLVERKQILVKLLNKLEEVGSFEWWHKMPSKSRIQIIIFLSESADGSQLWSNTDCSNLVRKICQQVSIRLKEADSNDPDYIDVELDDDLGCWFRRNYEECLTYKETDFHNIVQQVRGKYNKADWKYYPPSVSGFEWILHQIYRPQLANFTDLIIPPALLFSDDHYDDFKIVGLKVLAHVVENCDSSDLIRNNWANVIYDAVQRHCSDKDPVVINLMMTILMRVLQMIEKNPCQNTSEFTQYDHLFKQILFQMEFCSELPQKRAWLPILDNYMTMLGLSTLRWSDKICDVLRDCTTCSDPTIWKNVADVTTTLVRNTWVKLDCEIICEILLRLIFNVSSFHAVCMSESEKSEIVERVGCCFKLIQKCDEFTNIENNLTDVVQNGKSQNLHPDFVDQLIQILSINN